jgi:hypothetical protein
MITIPATNINEICITGQVIGVTYYDDHDKLVFTLKNTEGRFCVELCPSNSATRISRGDKVIVHGSLFSLRSGSSDAAKIRANLLQRLNTGAS